MLHVALNSTATRFVVHGGDPDGGDKINRLVSSWPGWARVRVAGRSPGHRDGQGEAVVVKRACSVYAGPLSITSALALSGTTLPVQWEDEARARVRTLLKQFEESRKSLEGPVTWTDYPATGRKPRDHQTRAVAAGILLNGRFLLADEMGLGKTSTGLWLAHALGADRILVLCPASVKFNWRNEVFQTLGETWPVQVIDGTRKARTNLFSQLRALYEHNGKLAIVINYDLLKYLDAEQIGMLTRFAKDAMIIMDESHYLKNSEAERTKIVKRSFCPSEGGARWRIAMSGTPIRNTVEDLYSQVELIQPGTFFTLNWFLNRFTIRSTLKIPYTDKRGRKRIREQKKVRSVTREKELNQIINTLQIRRLKKDVSNLPPKVLTYPELELDDPTKKIYAAMRDYALLLLEEQDDRMPVLSPTCRTAVEAAARCEQIAQGCIGGVPEELLSNLSGLLSKSARKVKGKDNWLVFPGSTKIQWLCEQLETVKQQGGQSVVFGRFNAPLFWLEQRDESEEAGVCVHGGIPAAKRQSIFDLFQAGHIRELYIQVRIAEGFNLFAAQDEFFLGRDWAWSVNAQAMDRCHREGQKGTVNVQMPYVRGTIEVRQHSALQRKERDADNTLCFQTIADLKEALSAT